MKYIIQPLKFVLAALVLIAIVIALLFGHKDIPLDRLKSKYANEASSFMELNDMSVHFRDEGNKEDSLPIVLIHGTGASLHTFEGWAEELKEKHRVISMDLPGYGLTGPFPDRDYSIDNYVRFMDSFLSSLEIDKCILGGNSLGGRIAWAYTLEHPDNVEKLVLIDASGYPSKSKSTPLAFKLAQSPILKQALTFITPRFIAEKSVKNVYADKSLVKDEVVDRYFEMMLRKGNRQAFVDRFSISSSKSSYKEVAEIEQPTLILWGKEDQLIPVEMAYKFQNDLPSNTLVILDGLGHVPMEENPSASLKPVLEFINN